MLAMIVFFLLNAIVRMVDKLRIAFTILYILVDLVYVYTSKSVYDEAVMRIQGTPMPTRLMSALAAYACMAVGWYVFAAGTAKRWSLTMAPVLAGALVGLLYGFLVIGTFNFTLHAMLNNYDMAIAGRDMMWGIGWSVVVTTLYAVSGRR